MATTKPYVLVIDDDSIRTLLHDALVDDGYEVRSAGTTRDALALVAERIPDAIMLDMRMPDDGPEFKRELDRRTLDAPIIAMSASLEGRS